MAGRIEVPICELLTPSGIEDDKKIALMKKLTAHIDEAYPHMATHVFLREASRRDVMFNGVCGSEAAKDARVCTLLCPPTAGTEAIRTMLGKVHGDILEAYATPADLFIIHRVDDLAHVMVNGMMGSDNPKYRQASKL
jgi:hypothetical protein